MKIIKNNKNIHDTGIKIKSEDWKSYDLLNERLIYRLRLDIS